MKFQESSWPFSCGIFSWLPCQTLLQRAGATCGHSDWLAGGFGRSPHHTQKGSHKCTLCSWRWNSRQCGDCCWELENMKNSINITLNNHRKQQKIMTKTIFSTFDEPLAIPIDRVVSCSICHIARWSPQNLPVALAVPCLVQRRLGQQENDQDEGDREGGGHHWHCLKDGKGKSKVGIGWCPNNKRWTFAAHMKTSLLRFVYRPHITTERSDLDTRERLMDIKAQSSSPLVVLRSRCSVLCHWKGPI